MKDWCLEVWGDYACFTRPEMKVERVSYDVITPSAARAIFEAILWKPSIKWNITKIEVLKPIKFVSVRRNEVGKTISPPRSKQISGEDRIPEGIYIERERQQRSSLCLKDVKYRIHGYFDFLPGKDAGRDESQDKYAAMFERRATKGQCFHRPYLGTREFSCFFRLVDPQEDSPGPIPENRDLGFMLYDMNFSKDSKSPPPLFFRAVMDNGIIDTDRRKVKVIG